MHIYFSQYLYLTLHAYIIGIHVIDFVRVMTLILVISFIFETSYIDRRRGQNQ